MSCIKGWGRAAQLVVFAGLFLIGCIKHTRVLPKEQVVLAAEKATKDELLKKLKSQSLAIKTLMVTRSTIKPTRMSSKEAIDEYIGVGAIIAVDRPNRIFLEIEKLGLTVVDMVSDGKQFKVLLRKTTGGYKFGVGDSSISPQSMDFPYNLRPSHILDALFVDGDKYLEEADVLKVLHETAESQPDGLHSYYVISFIRGEVLLEDIWYDRTIKQFSKKLTYKTMGEIESDIRYSKYETVDSIEFPKTIIINRPLENYVLEMNFEKLELNKPVNDAAFTLERPSNAEDLDLNTGKVIKPQ